MNEGLKVNFHKNPVIKKCLNDGSHNSDNKKGKKKVHEK